ncbi:hypothetical protein B566_EDAN010090 [Ephemera danica]|nr:hypothetical protein B566_EDAN010090 [Ephemera danica]
MSGSSTNAGYAKFNNDYSDNYRNAEVKGLYSRPKNRATAVLGSAAVVMTPDCTEQVGTITKQWSGFIKESFTDADNFSVTFPKDLDVKMKAVMLGACFFIDFMHFENNKRKKESGLAGILSCLLNCQG